MRAERQFIFYTGSLATTQHMSTMWREGGHRVARIILCDSLLAPATRCHSSVHRKQDDSVESLEPAWQVELSSATATSSVGACASCSEAGRGAHDLWRWCP